MSAMEHVIGLVQNMTALGLPHDVADILPNPQAKPVPHSVDDINHILQQQTNSDFFLFLTL